MTNVKTLALGAVAALALTAPAMAGSLADPVVEPVPAAPVAPMATSYDWTGFYAGAHLGYGEATIDGTSTDGFAYGVQAGYLYDFGTLVVGGEVSYTYLDEDALGGIDTTQLKARVGYDAGKFLPYLTAGAAYSAAAGQNDWGYLVGAGVDYAVTDTIRVGLEYTYNAFDDFDDLGFDADGNAVTLRVNYAF